MAARRLRRKTKKWLELTRRKRHRKKEGGKKRKKIKLPKEPRAEYPVRPDYGLVGAQAPMPMDPLTQMMNMTREAYVNPRKRHLLPRMQQNLWNMTRAQLPGTYQSTTPMDAPILSAAEARQLSTARHDSRPQADGSQAAAASMARTFGERDHVLDPRPGPMPGAPVYERPQPEPRDQPETEIFLADVVNRQVDDVFREVAFRLVDTMGLEVGTPSDRYQITLVNPKTKDRVTFDDEEFREAVAFIADVESRNVTALDPESKTAQLLFLFSRPDPRTWLRRWVGGRLPDDIRHEDARTVQDNLRAWTTLQERLNWVRDEVTPVTSAPEVRSWLQTLTLGMAGRPSAAVTAERLAGAVPGPQRGEVTDLLKGMRAAGLMSWTDSAQMVDGATGETLTNTNLYNILNNMFSPQSRGHPTHYVPTGLDQFVEKTMELQRQRGQVSTEVVRAVEAAAATNGQRRWTQRQDRDGTWVSLTRLWNLFRSVFPLARMGIPSVIVFIQAMQSMNLVDFSWHAWLGRMQVALGVGGQNSLAVAAETWAEPILTLMDNMTGGVMRGPVQNLITHNSQHIGTTIGAAVGSTIGSALTNMCLLAGAIGAWAMRWFRAGQVPAIA